jgi:hypothetical protein
MLTLHASPYTIGDGLNSFNLSPVVWYILHLKISIARSQHILKYLSASPHHIWHNYVPFIHSAFISATVRDARWHDMSERKKFIWGSHSSDYDIFGDIMDMQSSRSWPTFWRLYVPPKYQWASIRLRGITSQKIVRNFRRKKIYLQILINFSDMGRVNLQNEIIGSKICF